MDKHSRFNHEEIVIILVSLGILGLFMVGMLIWIQT